MLTITLPIDKIIKIYSWKQFKLLCFHIFKVSVIRLCVYVGSSGGGQ
jgi:hypothetical protein